MSIQHAFRGDSGFRMKLVAVRPVSEDEFPESRGAER